MTVDTGSPSVSPVLGVVERRSNWAQPFVHDSSSSEEIMSRDHLLKSSEVDLR